MYLVHGEYICVYIYTSKLFGSILKRMCHFKCNCGCNHFSTDGGQCCLAWRIVFWRSCHSIWSLFTQPLLTVAGTNKITFNYSFVSYILI